LFKLNFEKTAVFVLILIICISAADIFRQFFSMSNNDREPIKIDSNITKNIGFPASLLKADQLFKQGLYEDAQEEYFKLTNMPSLSPQQKALVHFKLGVSNFRLKKYDMARNSFLKSAEFNVNDPVAYNNAAVCSFYMNDMEEAEKLQYKAVENLPAIEYYYNLARIYEAWGRYGDSVKYFTAVTRAEENITMDDRIDPVRIKNKVIRLTEGSDSIGKLADELMIALRLKDTREVFIIEDADMDIKGKNFRWDIVRENGTNRLSCTYDREKNDPYNLIDSLEWTVQSGGKTVFSSKKDSFSIKINQDSDYIVHLDINYDSNKTATSYYNVQRGTSAYSNGGHETVTPVNAKTKYYPYAIYEQVFEKNYVMSEKGYVDRFNTVWGKDEITTSMSDKDFIDAQNAIYIKNTADRRAGIWADLSSLINDKKLKNKTLKVMFYAKKVSEEAMLYVNIKVKTGNKYDNRLKRYQLGDKWQQYDFNLSLPSNAEGLTMSFKTGVGEEIKMDGFIITAAN
jgi:tetratricopeptide (TPR) repeat protein